MFSPCRGLLLPTGRPDLRALRITAANKWIPVHDSVMHVHAAAALNYYILVLAFAQGLPSLPWFRGIASICKQAGRPQAAGAAPWVQCYLLSQLKRGSPQAGTGGSWAHAWLLTPTCLLMATRRCTQHRGDSFQQGGCTFGRRFQNLYHGVPCCLINKSDLHGIVFLKRIL